MMMSIAATIDWPVVITAIKDTTLAIAAIVTAGVAVVGLSKWRQEIKGKADFETARAYVRATYKLRDEIGSARAPFVRATEFPEGFYKLGVTREDIEEATGWAHVFNNRMAPVQAALQEMEVHALEAESLWGANARRGAVELRRCVVRLESAMTSVITDKHLGGAAFESDKEMKERVEKDVYGLIGDEENPLSKRIRDAIVKIERIVQPHLSRR